ncbi:hypothetical protein NIA69_03665 [Gemmiger formicilis]|nr:hypothetical protein [Gemmiger formicilis]
METADKLTRFVHALDDTRPVTAGINVLLNVYAQKGIGVYKAAPTSRSRCRPSSRRRKRKSRVLRSSTWSRRISVR